MSGTAAWWGFIAVLARSILGKFRQVSRENRISLTVIADVHLNPLHSWAPSASCISPSNQGSRIRELTVWKMKGPHQGLDGAIPPSRAWACFCFGGMGEKDEKLGGRGPSGGKRVLAHVHQEAFSVFPLYLIPKLPHRS